MRLAIFFEGGVRKMAERLVQITRYKRGEYIDMIRGLDARKRETIFEPQLPLERLSKYVEKSVTARSKEAIPDCLTCGVCCAYLLIVSVQRSDTPRLDEYWDVVADDAEDVVIDRVLPRNFDDYRCKYLGGELGKEIACSIYPNRPDACRVFEAGSDRCHEYRRVYGIEPRLSDEELEIEVARVEPLRKGIISFAVIDAVSAHSSIEFGPDGTAEMTSDHTMRISVFLDEDGETAHELHQYRASAESWFESDFLGMTIDEARGMIASNTRG